LVGFASWIHGITRVKGVLVRMALNILIGVWAVRFDG